MPLRVTNKFLMEVSYLTGQYLLPPEFLSLIITFKCNFRCQTCSIWQKKNFDELGEEEWLKIISDLKNTFGKNTFMELNGGEPLLRKNLVLTLIKNLKQYFSTVALNTNGSTINNKTVKELEEAGLNILKLSFYSLDKTTHNSLRGEDQAYDQAIKTIELITKSKIKLEIGLLITSKNIKGIPELIKYLNSLPNVSIILQPLDESVESAESKNKTSNQLLTNLWPNQEEVEELFNWILKNNQKIKNSPNNIRAIKEYYLNPKNVLHYRCFAGQRNLVVYPNGDAALCFKGQKIGNLTNQKIKTVLKQANSERKIIKKCPKYCRIIGCNFSRGIPEFIKDKLKIKK